MNLLYVRTVYICETGFVFMNKGGEDVDEFEKLLDSVRVAVERFVRSAIGKNEHRRTACRTMDLQAVLQCMGLSCNNRQTMKISALDIAAYTFDTLAAGGIAGMDF